MPRRNGNGRNGAKLPEAQLLRGIKQGVAQAVAQPFGAPQPKRRPRRRRARGGESVSLAAFDAFQRPHLPLPRAVGPYTVIRTTLVIDSPKQFWLFGTYTNDHPTGALRQGPAWTNIAAIADGALGVGGTIGGAANADKRAFTTMALGTGFDKCSLTPAAYSVQIMNPQALQTTQGVVYAGRSRTQLNLSADSRTWQTLANQLVSYNQPRLLSAAKLAMRGVQIDAVPMNMSMLSDFTPIDREGDGDFTWNNAIANTGFAPIFVYNPNGIALQYLITCEWRVRFDPSNPAQATHKYYPPASDSTWSRMLAMLEAGAHGVSDIVERVADYGETAQRLGAAGSRLRRLAGPAQLMLA